MPLLERIAREEGFRSHPYKDSRGFLTIGHGFNIDPSGPGLAEDESLLVLNLKLQKVRAALVKALPWTKELDIPRFDVLTDMAYNMGLPTLLKFKNTLSLIKEGKYEEAAKEMLESNWAKQVGERASNLAQIMKTGVDE